MPYLKEDLCALAARFWSRVDIKSPDECWNWTGSSFKSGNAACGALRFGGRPRRAPRIAWLLTTGSWPLHEVCHKCDNPLCVNPSHLWDGTHQENMVDMWNKGRRKSLGHKFEPLPRPKKVLKLGEKHYAAKLTDAQALEIIARVNAGEPQYVIAKEFGISQPQVSNLKNGRKRKYLKRPSTQM